MVSMLLAVGAVLRLTRLAATDVITEPLRRPLRGWLLKLVTCGWCASIWIGLGIVTPTWWLWGHTPVWQAVTLGLTASWVAGVTHQWGNGKPSTIRVAAVSNIDPLTVYVDDIPDLDDDTHDDEGS